jgi:hypothetical protein
MVRRTAAWMAAAVCLATLIPTIAGYLLNVNWWQFNATA